ncbi:hypothetical protein CAI21_22065 [Alkalilimnicola ehrlichii]|uniref:Uncharacterized protein n=1 Tax=Alkalilimnicola ehrlichii TaxID=351052 RepID=A0A3E0WHX3_9GAMM|nr:AAA domain-containing protein [Alkalilimnicola ehrlichii]RFA24339.1 hypothetical protein CAI21_22065 [Alkalilimnicola ehrlichii]RFA31566.1 hypothetical protein CAL65_22245 [Alkalilimnicola ehrlichii]
MASNDETLRNLIAYFRDCLLADGGERQLLDVFGRDEREPFLFPCAPESWVPVEPLKLPADYAERLIALLRVQRQERELAIGTCLVSGPAPENKGRARQVRAPLFLFEPELLQRDGEYAVRAQPDTLRLNPTALAALGLSPEQLGHQHALEDGILRHALAQAERQGHSPTANGYPAWRSGQAARWSATGVVWAAKRSQLARSVAYELDELSSTATPLAAPVRQLLGAPAERSPRVRQSAPETLPISLTLSQERALQNAARETISVINGPPGTGKTFTIAAQTIDRVLRQERVLIVCSNEHAADVVRGKLAEAFGAAQGLIVRAGRGDYRSKLLSDLDALLAGEADTRQTEAPAKLAAELQTLARRYRRSEHQFQKALATAEKEGAIWRNGQASNPWHRLRAWWLHLTLSRRPLLAQRWQALQEQVAAHQQRARHYLEALANDNLHRLLRDKRRQLTALTTALRSRASGHRESRFEALDWDVLTQAFPVWVVSAQTLHRVLPPTPELFELAIIDEATQCSLPLALPALQRARRAVIVGDPKQLRHFSFVSRDRQRRLAGKHQVDAAPVDLNYRERSLLDYGLEAVSSGEAIVLLDEHFRSRPELIAFSNERFYNSRLKVLTHLKANRGDLPIEVIDCPVRQENEVNAAEIDTLLARLEQLIQDASELPDHECPSIGVLAFFRATAAVLERELLERYPLGTLSRHDIRVGTPYAFQGEERDLMLIATGVYPGRAAAAWNYLNRADVFNVAVTRARYRQILFMPKAALEDTGPNLLADYVEHAQTTAVRQDTRVPAHDAMRRELIAALEAWGAQCRPDYCFAGQQLDLLVLYQGRALAVDTIGSDASAGEAWEWERYRLLERAGLIILPIGFTAWQVRRDAVLEQLRQALGMTHSHSETESAGPALSLRWRLQELNAPSLLELLDALERHYRQAVRWLGERFEASELTYDRYRSSIDRLRQAALDELQGACLLLESLRDLGPGADDPRLRTEVDSRMDSGRAAVASMERLAQELAVLRTEDSGLDAALADVARLAERVHRYGKPSPRPREHSTDTP